MLHTATTGCLLSLAVLVSLGLHPREARADPVLTVLSSNFGNGISDAAGTGPMGVVLDAAGDLFGVTVGDSNVGGTGPARYGTAFRISADHRTRTVLHVFTGGADGAQPSGPLVADPFGNLYGTTFGGGSGGGFGGTVFELTGTGYVTLFDVLLGRGAAGAASH